MRLQHAVIKRSLGRMWLHDLRSAYHVELNPAALTAVYESLEGRGGAGDALVARLRRHGLVDDATPFEPIPERGGGDLVSLELEPVGTCNLECGHCFAGFSGATMSDETFAAVLRGAEALGAVELTFNGGEPLLQRQTLERMEAAAQRGFRVLLFTNGTLVTERTAQRLAAIPVARVTISLDGFEAVNDALRGPGAFRRAEAGIKNLVAVGVPVFVTTVVTPANEGELAALQRYCRETLGVAGLRVSTVAEMGRAAGKAELQLDPARFQAVYAAEAKQAPRVTEGRLPCNAGVDKLYVTARGEVHGCHLFDGVSPPLGVLGETPLEVLHASLEQRSGGALLRRFTADQLHGCQDCPALATCLGGCRARAWQMSGDALGVDPVSCRKFRAPATGSSST